MSSVLDLRGLPPFRSRSNSSSRDLDVLCVPTEVYAGGGIFSVRSGRFMVLDAAVCGGPPLLVALSLMFKLFWASCQQIAFLEV